MELNDSGDVSIAMARISRGMQTKELGIAYSQATDLPDM